MTSWIGIAADHQFGLHTLPFGVFTDATRPQPRVGVAIGEAILDLTAASAVLLPEHAALFCGGTLDALLAAGRSTWSRIRIALTGEAENGYVVGTASALGRRVPLADFADHVFGVCLVNDWSARDIQAWEYIPLGPLRTGDLIASGAVSGAAPAERGCLLELSWNGSTPLTLADGSTRSFLADGDEVSITATAPGPAGSTVGLGEVRGRICALVKG